MTSKEEASSSSNGKRDVDYILQEIVGGCGKWQWIMTIAMFPLLFTGGYPLFLPVFSVNAPKHRCYVEQCDSESSNYNESWADFALPKDKNSKNILRGADPYDPCLMYTSEAEGSCVPETFDSASNATSCDKYVYDRSQFQETLATEINLVCGEDYKRRLLSSVMMAGLMAGSIIGGQVSDRFGRKKTMFLSLALNIPSVTISGFIPNYYIYAVLRFFTCTALSIIWVSGHTFGLEIFSPKYRRVVTSIKDIPFAAYVFVAVIYFNRHWSYMHLTVGILSLLALPVWFVLPESPRWLASNGRKEEAEEIFLKIAKTNGRVLTPEQQKDIKDILDTVDAERDDHLNPLDMFRREHLVKTLILLLCWNTTVVGYYALTLNATKLNGDAVLNFLYSTMFDTPVFILVYFVLDGWGRRWTTFASQFVMGVCALTMAFVPKDQDMIIFIAYMIGRTAGGIGFLMVYLVTAELYPTNLRSTAVGICSMLSRIGGMGANFVPVLAVYWQPLPMIVLGVPALLAALLSLHLSETSGKDLPQTMREAEELDEEAHHHHHHHNEGGRDNIGMEDINDNKSKK